MLVLMLCWISSVVTASVMLHSYHRHLYAQLHNTYCGQKIYQCPKIDGCISSTSVRGEAQIYEGVKGVREEIERCVCKRKRWIDMYGEMGRCTEVWKEVYHVWRYGGRCMKVRREVYGGTEGDVWRYGGRGGRGEEERRDGGEIRRD